MNDQPPEALANHPRYRVGELLGVGGMGVVYKAEHLLMERPVALKVLNRELIDKPATIERFRREVRAAARLTHPNIVAGFDAEQAGDVHFLVMEYVEGVSLARLIAEKGPLPVEQACDFVRQAALGLEHAHERGMVHRDIKPQNLMLTPGGQVKILDFGLARFVMESVPAGAMLAEETAPVADHPNGEAPCHTDGELTVAHHSNGELTRRAHHWNGEPHNLTQTGIVMGTPDYIAPEQARDSHVADIRADIYSLGCTLYDLLAGHAPFPGGSAVQKVKAHSERTPLPLRDLRRDVPPELAKIIERMMAKDPAQRYQTPVEVAAALTPYLAPPKPPRRKRWAALVAGFACAAALIAGIVIYVQTDNGTIVIETDDNKIAVMIEKAGGVKIVDQANQREYHLQVGEKDIPSGNYQIKVSEPLAGLEFQVNKFELKRGKEVRLTAKLAGKGKEPPPERTLTASEREAARKRLESLNEILRLNEAMFRSGQGTFDQVLKAKRDIAKVELTLCETDRERIKIYERLVMAAQELVDVRNTLFQAGRAMQVEVLNAKVELQEAKSDLERALARVAVEEKGYAITGGKKPDVSKNEGDVKKWLTSPPKSISKEEGPLYAGKPASFWLNQLQDSNPTFRVEAVKALGSIAKKNEGLIPVLVVALKDDGVAAGSVGNKGKSVKVTVALAASKALSTLGPAAVPALLEALKDKTSPTVLHHAVLALGNIGPQAKAAVPILADELKRKNWAGLYSAATCIIALGKIGPDAKPAMPALIEVLGEELKSLKEDEGKKKAEEVFGISKNSISAMAALATALPKIDPEIREIIPSIFSEVPGFMRPGELTPQPVVAQWQKAYEALQKRYPPPPSAPSPFEGLQFQRPADQTDVRPSANGTLYRGKPASFWLDQFKDSDPKFRGEAVTALGSIAQKNKDVIPVLVEALAEKDYGVASQAVAALGSLGPEVVPVILDVLKKPKSPTAFTNAAKVVGKIGAPAKDAVPFLDRGLKADATDGPDQRAIILALGRIGPEAKPAIPALVETLGRYLESVKDSPKQGKTGPGIGTGPLASPTSWPRKVLEAVQQIDPDVKEVLPERINNGTAFMGGAQNWTQLKEIWDQTYAALKKRYTK